MTVVLRMEKISKEYRGVKAVQNVDFDLQQGELHSILGENGAGKSTLTKLMAGVIEPTNGELFVNDQKVEFQSPSEALKMGIAMVFQETSLVPSMTVAQNLFLGNERFLNRLRRINILAQQFLQSLNFTVSPTALVMSLGAAQRQMLEIARAVRLNANILIFDEPTASLTPEEKKHLFSLIQRLRESGVSVIFISHALEESLQISDRITVLRDGEKILTEPTGNLDRNKVIQAMIGRSLSYSIDQYRSQQNIRPAGRRIMSVQGLSMGNLVKNNSFSVFSGQITTIFGLVGSGRTETAKIISGIYKRDFARGGQIDFHGRAVRYRVPSKAVADGIVYVTEDRKNEGFFDKMTVGENLYSGYLSSKTHNGLTVSMREMRDISRSWIKKVSIKAINDNANVVELSGGNQQKTVIGKTLIQEPELCFFDEPTRGVDVSAIDEIHELIGNLADSGLAVIVISSYLPEVRKISDRILVCRQGRIVEEFSPTDVSDKDIMFAAVH
ncbi:MAG: sugar ABC transporter ATP-binding protein [Gammaproteobacteria bacterium]|nr:sugar ABC transporter ATP-binding protein [Gammaproteobacteria bacterium]